MLQLIAARSIGAGQLAAVVVVKPAGLPADRVQQVTVVLEAQAAPPH